MSTQLLIISNIISFITGLIIGLFIKRKADGSTERFIMMMVIIGAWTYTLIVNGTTDWWLNVFMGLMLGHFFDIKALKDKAANLIHRK